MSLHEEITSDFFKENIENFTFIISEDQRMSTAKCYKTPSVMEVKRASEHNQKTPHWTDRTTRTTGKFNKPLTTESNTNTEN